MNNWKDNLVIKIEERNKIALRIAEEMSIFFDNIALESRKEVDWINDKIYQDEIITLIRNGLFIIGIINDKNEHSAKIKFDKDKLKLNFEYTTETTNCEIYDVILSDSNEIKIVNENIELNVSEIPQKLIEPIIKESFNLE